MKNEEKLVNVEFVCPMCGITHYIYEVPMSLVERVQNRRQTGEYIQDILKDYSPKDREKFMTGFCDDCQKKIFTESEED